MSEYVCEGWSFKVGMVTLRCIDNLYFGSDSIYWNLNELMDEYPDVELPTDIGIGEVHMTHAELRKALDEMPCNIINQIAEFGSTLLKSYMLRHPTPVRKILASYADDEISNALVCDKEEVRQLLIHEGMNDLVTVTLLKDKFTDIRLAATLACKLEYVEQMLNDGNMSIRKIAKFRIDKGM